MLKITYKGQQYNDIKDAFRDSLADKIIGRFEKRLEPFQDEIKACGGEVEIDVPDSFKGATIALCRLPEELATRIKEALR